MAAAKDLYAVLGVARSATKEEITRAFRRLARKHHPDVNPGSKQAEERFKELNAAYEVLSNPDKRKLYDEFGEDSLRSGFDAERARAFRRWSSPAGAPRPPRGVEGFGVDFGEVFGNFFRSRRRQPSEARGKDLMVELELDFAQAIRGTAVTVAVPDARQCTACDGTGRARGRARCARCGGSGEVAVERPLTVRVPPGAEDGSRLEVRGRGAPGPAGGAAGDLVIVTRVRSHPHFRRDGLDLHLKLPVTVDEAYNGAAVDVPTASGSVQMKVPPRSQSGAKLRLRGQGVARGYERGDLYVELEVRLPDRDDSRFADAARSARSSYARPVREGIRL